MDILPPIQKPKGNVLLEVPETPNEEVKNVAPQENRLIELKPETKSEDVTETAHHRGHDKNPSDKSKEEAGEDDQLRHLCYGDKIKLYLELSDTDRRKGTDIMRSPEKSANEPKQKYYISTDGIATGRIFFHKGESSHKENDVFTVVCASESRVLNRLKGDLKTYVKNIKTNKKIEETDSLSKEEAYQQEVPQEIMNNWTLYKKSLGKPVRYNDVIQLVNEKTQQYVKISKKVDLSAPQPSDAVSKGRKTDFMRVYSLKLDSGSGPETHFMLSPCFKYQERDNVLAQDSFCLAYKDSQLLNKQFFLHFQPTGSQADSKQLYNFYLTEEEKTPIRFELYDESYLKSHLFAKIHKEPIWITHIQAPVYLCLKKIEKATDQGENELDELIEHFDEEQSQAFSLTFNKYDENKQMSSDGLWVGYASEKEQDVVVFRHIQYGVRLKPLHLKQLVRTDKEEGAISEGSIFKLSVKEGEYIEYQEKSQKKAATPDDIQTSLPENLEENKKSTRRDLSAAGKDDYFKSFKVVMAGEQQQPILTALADLARYIRIFDMETLKRYGDYTEEALTRILSSALRRLRLLCTNGLPATLQQSYPYKQPIDIMQRFVREMGCIDSVAALLLKLFPGGASVDYSENEFMRKLLGQLLTLISIAVKDNKESKMYTFQRTMGTIQKYIGLNLPKRQEDKALLSVVENCEEILLDNSLGRIINQFVRELANNNFKEKMKKKDILKILRIFCVNENKGISGTQNLLYNTLFETEIGSKVLLCFTFRSIENDEIILKVDGDKEINCCQDWPEDDEKHDILRYFKYELYLFADMIHQNDKILKTLKELFPVHALIKNLQSPALDNVAKTGLTRMFTSLFMNSERLLYVKKPRTQRVLGEDQVAGLRRPSYITPEQLEEIKNVIYVYFSENSRPEAGSEDLWLHYEYLRLLTYLLNSDFLLGEASTKEEWKAKLASAYQLLIKAFFFCGNHISMILEKSETGTRRRTTTGNLAQVHDEAEDAPVISTAKGLIKEEQLAEAPRYFRFPLQYLFIFRTIASGELKKDLHQSYSKDIDTLIQEEICNFMTQLIYFMHDGYITAFSCLTYRNIDIEEKELLTMTKRFMMQIFGSKAKEEDKKELVYEVKDALEYKNIKAILASTPLLGEGRSAGDELFKYFTELFILSKDERLGNLILEVLIGSQFGLNEFGRYLENLFFIMNSNTDQKQKERPQKLDKIIQQLSDLINHSTNSLNVSDIKNLRQVSMTVAKFKDLLGKLSKMFVRGPTIKEGTTERFARIRVAKTGELDQVFTKLFTKTKGYLVLIEFLKLCSSAKLEAARNVLEGNEELGLHAVTASNALLEVIKQCNYILISFCKSSTKARIRLLKHIPRITLIPPPKPKDSDTKWGLFTDCSASDIQLINEICKGNNQIAYLNNQQVGYFKELVALLNQSICPINIGKIFEVFENILDQTTHDGLYKDILGYFWDNKRHIVAEKICKYDTNTDQEEIERMMELVKVSKLLAQSAELKIAKLKLKDIFPIEIFSSAFKAILKLYSDRKDASMIPFLQNLAEVYAEVYLSEKVFDSNIIREFDAVFDAGEALLKEISDRSDGENRLVDTLTDIHTKFSIWKRKLNFFEEKAGTKISLFGTPNASLRNLSEAEGRASPSKTQTEDMDFKSTLRESKSTMSQSKGGSSERLRKIKRKTLLDAGLNKCISEEMREFSKKLIFFIDKAGLASDQITKAQQKEKDMSRQFIGKLIEHIGNCGRHEGKSGVIKYLLMSLIGVLDMAGEDQMTMKGKHKAKKRILLTLDNLKLTKTLLSLLCSDESESLDAILPALLRLANKMLNNSIGEIQDQFYKEFESNKKSEKLFERMCTAINRNVFIYHWHPQMFAMNKNTKIFQTIAEIDIQKEILIFIKLLCENHHEELQEFMHTQKAYKNKYDMIGLLVRYLETLVKEIKVINDRSPEQAVAQESKIVQRKRLCYGHSILALRALSECMQGPCKVNQEAIGDSDFMVIANEILNLHPGFGAERRAQQKCYFSNHELCEIKNECAIVLLSLLEQRTVDDQIIIKMRQCISEAILVENLMYVYYAFMLEKDANYSEELLFNAIDEQHDKQKKDSFVLGLGFTLLFILKKWFELCKNYSSPLREMLSTITTKVTSLQSDEYGFFGDIISFGIDFVVGFVFAFTKAVKNVVMEQKEFDALKQEERFTRKALEFFQNFSGTIEIVRDNHREIVHFPILPYAEALTEQQQTEAFSGMPIGQAKAKLDYFMGGCMSTLQTMKNEYLFAKTFRRYPVFGAVAKHLSLWNTLAFYTAIAINIIMLFSYRKVESGYDDRLDNPSLIDKVSVDKTKQVIYILGIFLCTFSSIQVLSFLFKYIPSVYNKSKAEYNEEAEKQTSSIEMVKLRAQFLMKLSWELLGNPQIYYNLAYLILGLLGILLHPLFFTYHLLSVIFRYQKLIDVLQAFWGPIAEIVLTLVFFLVIEYVFAVLAYVFFADMYPDYTCYSLLSCFIITLDQTFKNNGGFGAFMDQIYTPNETNETVKYNYGRLIFDQMSNFILLILIVQILAGLIIDKFGEIREDSENMEEELKSNCVICGEKGDVIERKTGETFEQHKEVVHNLWNYLLFIGYIKRKPKLEFNGIESWVYDHFKRQNIGWLPYSLWEGKDDGEKDAKINAKLKDIQLALKDDPKE